MIRIAQGVPHGSKERAMDIYEIGVGRLGVSENGGPFQSEPNLRYLLAEDAIDRFQKILDPYDQSAHCYLDNFIANFIPWVTVCLDRDYALAAYVDRTRSSKSKIGFAPYSRALAGNDADIVPKVGAIFIHSKPVLRGTSGKSLLFQKIMDVMEHMDSEKNWILFPDPLTESWAVEAEKVDEELWIASHSAPVT